jgi:alkanesulfonate monooxygenase SsuD/methylene tetrahydromethanopterin reductase-like flavin-dependent oxidoreductase (luciferase family)
MRFSIQLLASRREHETEAEVYANTLDECRVAERLGFHTIWLAEHHFSTYGVLPSLAVLAAAVSRETRRIRIGTAVVIAPFAHPLRIAEEWAMIDILSEGRLEFGLGRGYQPTEFRGLAVSMERTRERFDESYELIRRAWTEERCTFEGEFYQVRDLSVPQAGTEASPSPVDRRGLSGHLRPGCQARPEDSDVPCLHPPRYSRQELCRLPSRVA